jgi:WD40 repeat protein
MGVIKLRKRSWVVLILLLFVFIVGSHNYSVASDVDPVNTLVVSGHYDFIEKILDKLGGIEYRIIDVSGLASEDLTGISQIYINCRGTHLEINKVKAFVEAGGNLYVSDLSYPYIAPWGLSFSTSGNTGPVVAQIQDGGLKSFLNEQNEISIMYEAGGWAIITNKASATVLLSGNVMMGNTEIKDSPLAVTFSAGKGSVVFTTFHNVAGGINEPYQARIVEYFAVRPVAATTAQKVVKDLDLDVESIHSFSSNTLSAAKSTGVSVSSTPQGKSGVYIFAISDTILSQQPVDSIDMKSSGMSIQACNISLLSPNGNVYKTVDMKGEVIAINVPDKDNMEGDWTFKINSYSGYNDNAMVLGISCVGEVSDGGNNGNGGSGGKSGGGGCNNGVGAMPLAVLAVLALLKHKKK